MSRFVPLFALALLHEKYVSGEEAVICYSCYGESINSTCYGEPRGVGWVDCHGGQCQVWKLYSPEDPSQIYMFERSCSGICRSGCIEIADMGHRLRSCATCCDANFCNIGNSRPTSARPNNALLFFAAMNCVAFPYLISPTSS